MADSSAPTSVTAVNDQTNITTSADASAPTSVTEVDDLTNATSAADDGASSTTSSDASAPTYDPTTCIIEYDNWCGSIAPFTGQASCNSAWTDCVQQYNSCPNVDSAGVRPCGLYNGVCTQLDTFCGNCGDACDRSHFTFTVGNS